MTTGISISMLQSQTHWPHVVVLMISELPSGPFSPSLEALHTFTAEQFYVHRIKEVLPTASLTLSHFLFSLQAHLQYFCWSNLISIPGFYWMAD